MTQPDWNRLLKKFNRNPPALDVDVADFEAKSGVHLPEDYKAFLELSNGGEGFLGPEDEYAILWPINDIMYMNKVYAFTEYAPHLYIFGSNGGGEAFAFDRRSETLSIVAAPFIGFDEEDQTRPIAPDFVTFLEGMFPWGDIVDESSS